MLLQDLTLINISYQHPRQARLSLQPAGNDSKIVEIIMPDPCSDPIRDSFFPRIGRLNEERDGLGISLEIAQLDRRSVLNSIHVDRMETANSILDLLDTIQVQERSLLEHDRRIFQFLLGKASARSALFSDASETSVRVYVVDKTEIETVLGIDLIIYNDCYENFLLLQYKKMTKDRDGWAYPLDTHMRSQLTSMSAFRTALKGTPAAPPTLWSYRLNDQPIYFKFCEQVRPNSRDDSLIPGITLSEPHLREFLALPEAKGPRGGISVGYSNCPRYLNNTEFVQLARVGWIGAGKQAATLLKKMLEANKQGGRSAMLAVIHTPKTTSASQRAWKK